MNKNKDLIDLFFEENSLVRQHVNSFNYFIEKEMGEIVEANNIVDSDIDQDFYIKYLQIRVDRPTNKENMIETAIYPQECRNRDLTYSANIYVDIEYTKNKQVVVKRDLQMGKMPIMLRSNRCMLVENNEKTIQSRKTELLRLKKSQECSYDNGGYFIIKGVERVIQIQEQLSKNRIMLETGKSGIYSTVTSASIKHKSKTNVILKNDIFYIQNNIFSEEIPALTVIKAMGVGSDKSIVDFIGKECENLITLSFGQSMKDGIKDEQDALLELTKYIKIKPEEEKTAAVRSILAEKIIPNVETTDSLRNKGIFICLMIRKLALSKLKILKVDDKDFLGNKRFELAGQLLSILFEDTFKKFNFELKKSIDKILSKRTRTSEFDALTFFNLQTSQIATTLNRAIASGNWNLRRFRMERSGVTHIMTRYSYFCALGMMTKINSHFEKTRKVSGPRSLHPSSWGMFCPSDTPEGESCGLVKNLALLTEITTDSEIAPVEEILQRLGCIKVEFCNGPDFFAPDNFLVFLNGAVFGTICNSKSFADNFRKSRRKGKIDKFVSIYVSQIEKSIFISTDNGRICRPVIVVDHQSRFFIDRKINRDALQLKSFSELIKSGFIEYLDVNEQNNCRIAFKEEEIKENTTHMEIAEYAILSLIAALIPFPNHNQSPRNTYQCAMGKQAIGHIATNVKKRFDSAILQLNYTHRPLSASRVLDINKYNMIPAGLNAMVAVMSYSGYDIEDAIILNKAALDRGFGRVEVYKTNKIVLKKFPNGTCEFLCPTAENGGIIGVGSYVTEGIPLVTKISPADGRAVVVRHKGLPAYIDKILFTKSEDETMIKIVTRETRIPEIGDKVSSRHGQKGVVGLIVPQTDLPFNEEGISPDIIMNPHGFPSRMTVGKILEQVTGKACVLNGEFADATAFKQNEVEETCNLLTSFGYSYSGKDVFTSGTTGEQLEAYIFFGPIFYQRLKHMVADKMHCRARGPRAVLTRQPTEGRSKDGGLRLGEMERDCLIGYGTSQILNDRLMHCSDEFDAFVCEDCGLIAYKGNCPMCNKNVPVKVKMPYACKLLFQELMAMNIFPKITIKQDFE
ncbi:DNA-directed RNA polymerase [Nucleospora cyclopteri]